MPAPTVTSVSPLSGTTLGGAPVSIAGTNFTGTTAVTFDGVAAADFTVLSATSIIAHTPAHAATAIDVAVTNSSGTGIGTNLYTYTTPPSPAHNLYLFDDCCHNWFSSDTGGLLREGCTPGGPSTPAPDDPGQDPYGVGTLLDGWTDMSMAINDADYLTIVGNDYDYAAAFGILGISLNAGQNLTYTLVDPEYQSPAFTQDYDYYQPFLRVANTANAQTILLAPDYAYYFATDGHDCYPRLTTNSGATWNDVTGLPPNLSWYGVCFSFAASIMYIKPADDYIYKSTDGGSVWAQLSAGPQYIGIIPYEADMRLRCSADGQTIVMIYSDGNFWISKDGGTSWTNTQMISAVFGSAGTKGRFADCGVSPNGSTVVVSMELNIHSGYWPAVAVSTDGGSTFTDVSLNLKYPASVGTPRGVGASPTGCTQCNVAPDGGGIVVTYIYGDTPHIEPDGVTGYMMYANVSTDAGATFTLVGYDSDAYEAGSFLGLFTGIYITPFTPIPIAPTISLSLAPGSYIITGSPVDLAVIQPTPPAETEIHRKIRDPWDCDEWGRFQPGACIRPIY